MTDPQPGLPWDAALLRAAAVLYDAGATAVWLFGSRARSRLVDRLSDFDLGVEGLANPNGAFDRAASELGGKVDIISLESAPPALRWGILRNRVHIPRVRSNGHTARSRPPLPDSLGGWRTRAVAESIREAAPRSVIDFGCGYGWLLAELAADGGFERLTGVDFDAAALAGARSRVARAVGPAWRERVDLRESLITYRDAAFLGHDAAAAVEVVEHLEPPQLGALVGVLFEFVRPARIVLTTPNAEYNSLWIVRHPRGHRHADHRFEWSRADFAAWAGAVAADHGYDVRIVPIGTPHPICAAPSQMGVFDRRG